VNVTASANGDAPMETISIAFEKVEVEYTPQKSDGSADGAVSMKWNIKENKEG
jgi:type VI secretion system secreted protein Hcp